MLVVSKRTYDEEPTRWLVGYSFGPEEWELLYGFEDQEDAMRLVNYLNGGTGGPSPMYEGVQRAKKDMCLLGNVQRIADAPRDENGRKPKVA